MNANKTSGTQLIGAIDEQFINFVGPIGQLIIDDAKNLWRKKQWKGPSALRNYIKFLSENIDSKNDKEQFIQLASRHALEAASKKYKA